MTPSSVSRRLCRQKSWPTYSAPSNGSANAPWLSVDGQRFRLSRNNSDRRRMARGAQADTFEAYRSLLDEYRDKLAYVEGATGMAVAVGGTVVACDVFDKASTCKKVWGRLLSGFRSMRSSVRKRRSNELTFGRPSMWWTG